MVFSMFVFKFFKCGIIKKILISFQIREIIIIGRYNFYREVKFFVPFT